MNDPLIDVEKDQVDAGRNPNALLKAFISLSRLFLNTANYDKPLIFTGATFREKFVSHHQAMNINC